MNKVDVVVQCYTRDVYGELLGVCGGPHLTSFMLS